MTDPLEAQIKATKREIAKFEELLDTHCLPERTLKRLDKAIVLVKVGLKLAKNSLKVRL